MPTGEVVGTVTELWSKFVEYCNNLGISTSNLPTLTTPQEIVEYINTYTNIKLEPLYKTVTTLEQTGWTWVYNAPVNPAETTDIVARTVTDLTVVGGGATTVTSGKKLFGTVSRKIAAGAMIAALGVSTFAAQIGEHISRLVEGLTPWTVDGVDAVPVLIDEDGYTYLDERAVQKFREDLAELGVFDTQSICTDYPSGISTGVSFPLQLTRMEEGILYYKTGGVEHYDNYYIFPDFYVENINTGEKQFFAIHPESNVLTDILNPRAIGWIDTEDDELHFFFTTDSNNTRMLMSYLYYDESIGYYRSAGGGGYTIGNQFTYNNVTCRYINGNRNSSSNNRFICNDITAKQDVSSATYRNNIATTIRWGSFSPGGGVPGFVPTNPTVGDLTKSITQLYPDWASNGVSIPSPTDEDLTNTGTWLPVSITETEPFDQDHTATSSDQDGDTTEDTQQSIMDKLQELIQTIAQYQAQTDDEVITPTIPVEDSGDTPPATPTVISGASNGLWTIYNPTLSEVQQFGAWLWSDSIIDQIKRQFASPIDGVIGFMSIYCTPITGDRKMIKTGYLTSPVSAKEVTNQYVTINCGQVAVPEYYHSAIDYTRSKVDIFLPFIGIVPLDCSVVTGSTLEVIYRIDVLTGTCLAQIKVIKQNSDAVMYTYNGNCGVQLPLTAGTYTGLIGTLASLCSGAISAMSGNMIGVGESLLGMAHSMGTNIQKSGVLASNAGALGIRIPYLIITHPTAYDAMIYNQFYGYPSNVYQRLSAMSGYVRVKDIHLDDITCTSQELDMIYAKLKEGVIIS